MYLVFNLTLRLGICLPLKGTHFQTPSGVTKWDKYSGVLDEGGGQETRISFLTVSLNAELPSSEPNCPVGDMTWSGEAMVSPCAGCVSCNPVEVLSLYC